MISPTGLGIRNDTQGFGHYNARRGQHNHKGCDYEAVAGQPVVAPFDMILDRYSRPSTRYPEASGIAWKTPSGTGRMWYFVPIPKLIGTFVTKATVIGVAMDLTTYYNDKMTSHIHFQINSFDPEILRRLSKIMVDYRMFSEPSLN